MKNTLTLLQLDSLIIILKQKKKDEKYQELVSTVWIEMVNILFLSHLKCK